MVLLQVSQTNDLTGGGKYHKESSLSTLQIANTFWETHCHDFDYQLFSAFTELWTTNGWVAVSEPPLRVELKWKEVSTSNSTPSPTPPTFSNISWETRDFIIDWGLLMLMQESLHSLWWIESGTINTKCGLCKSTGFFLLWWIYVYCRPNQQFHMGPMFS